MIPHNLCYFFVTYARWLFFRYSSLFIGRADLIQFPADAPAVFPCDKLMVSRARQAGAGSIFLMLRGHKIMSDEKY